MWRPVFFLVFLCVGLGWSQVILDLRGYRYTEIFPWILKTNRIYDAIFIDTPFKGYSGRFFPTEEVYDYTDLGEKNQRGSVVTFLGSREEFDQMMMWAISNKLPVYVRVRLFQQRVGFLTNVWEDADFYPDYTVAFDRLQTSKKLKEIVALLMRMPVTFWVVDITGLEKTYQKKAAQWVRENFAKAFVMGDGEEYVTFSSMPFFRWRREIEENGRVREPAWTWNGVYVLPEENMSAAGVMYYFLARQKRVPIVITPGVVSLVERLEKASPAHWGNLRLIYAASDHLWGVSSEGVFSFYMGQSVRYTNYSLPLSGNLVSYFGSPYLLKTPGGVEGIFLPGSFSLWTIEK
ncbi:hypothetical protein [Thermospira aquatica]|uniref:Uncharacterized protein n=1 Tax=Thermospira aquatica TaxID=2828656 RepID=A0AAX3BB85_9SPIR|nr:hypothetical protein [Thermospira aquatica]URA09522.1 hypothetical protein KDW03_08490 [Thermospira aquatica]